MIFIIWIDCILFIHLSINERLGCFPFLAVGNNAAVNICVQVFVWSMFSVLWGVELLGHLVDLGFPQWVSA